MITVTDPNIHCVAVEGSFDDCQAFVKGCFNDPAMRKQVNEICKPFLCRLFQRPDTDVFHVQYNLGAVNSINWARILAQITYYFYAYFRTSEKLKALDLWVDKKISFSVPTGTLVP